MLKIKLARFGKKKQPHFRIVVNEARDKRDGRYVALLGHYAPTQEPKVLELNMDEYKAWLQKGAQPTETVGDLVKRLESGTPFPQKKARPSKKAKAKLEAEKQAAAEAAAKPAEPVVEETAAAEPEVAQEAAPEVPAASEASTDATAVVE